MLLTSTVNGEERVLANTTLPWVHEPTGMRVIAQGDGTTALQKTGPVAMFSDLPGSSTNAPAVVSLVAGSAAAPHVPVMCLR